ncbi:MAG: glycosyltransferase family 4 protein [Paracoccaceae bacterium]
MSDGFRPRVLLLAEAANPEWVSVPLVGWSLARALAAVADVHVVTQIRNRDAFLRAGMVEGVDFTAIDSEALARPFWRLGVWLSGGKGLGWTIQQAAAAISYPYFEHLVWKRFGADIRAGRFDIVHRITPLSPVQQSSMAARCRRAGVPFVLGPLNGGVPWPKAFQAEMRREREWLSKVRGAYQMLPGRQSTLRANAILAGSLHTMREFPARHQDRVIYMPENAIDPARFNATAVRGGPGPIRACFIGRLVPYKGAHLLIEAAAPLLRDGRLVLEIIGDGDMMDALRAQAAEFGDAVVFHGWKPHAQVQDIAARCQLLAFPSIREFGGGVVLEAMALGLAPIVVDYAGPAELVTDDTGWKVPITGRDGVIAGLAARLEWCVTHPAEVATKGDAARARVQALFTWDRKAEQVARVYHWVLHPQTPKPSPFG